MWSTDLLCRVGDSATLHGLQMKLVHDALLPMDSNDSVVLLRNSKGVNTYYLMEYRSLWVDLVSQCNLISLIKLFSGFMVLAAIGVYIDVMFSY
jgi:hypothetical protein